MDYSQNQIITAFKLYSTLSTKGYGDEDDLRLYLADDQIRNLIDEFAKEVDCVIFPSGDNLYFIPKVMDSPFHISNQSLKDNYLPSKYNNSDVYMMYIAIIVLFGAFYDSYQTTEITREFLPIDEWLNMINERMDSLKEHERETLKSLEKEYLYNWTDILDKWEALDDLKENVATQDARTNSRFSFLNTVRNFLKDQDLIDDIGNDEITLTEKAKTIIKRYYMEYDFNRGILDFIYGITQKEGEKNASNI